MKYIKSFKFWIVFLLSLYTFVGFIALPWFLTNKLSPILEQNVGLHVNIKSSSFNPYTMELTLKDVELNDLQNRPALEIEKIYLNYSPLALFESTFLFQNLEITRPHIFATFNEKGEINFQNLLQATPSETKQAAKEKEEKTVLPKIILSSFNLREGSLFFKDEKKDFTLNLGPYDFSIHDLSTAQESVTSHDFYTKVETGGEIFWEGGVSLQPLELYGTLKIEELQLPALLAYVPSPIPSKLQYGKVSLTLPYQVNFKDGLDAKVTNAFVNLKALTLTHKDEAIVDISNIDINNINVAYPKQDASVESIIITRPTIVTSLDKAYNLNLTSAFELPSSSNAETNSSKESKPWSFSLKELATKDGRVKFSDLKTDSYFEINNMNIKANNITSNKDEKIDYNLDLNLNSATKLSVLGDFTQSTLIANSQVSLSNLQLAYFKNYIEPFVSIDIQNGAIDVTAQVEADLKKQNTKVLADTFINHLLINAGGKEPLLAWEKFSLNKINFEQNPMALDVGSITLSKPFVKLQIAQDGSTNFSTLVKKSEAKEPKSTVQPKNEDKKQNKMKLRLGEMKLSDAKADFSDLSLPFPFHTKIHSLNGDFSELDLAKAKPSNLLLEGKIDEFGYTKIQGSLTPLAIKDYANIDVKFKNVDLTAMTPYSGKFVGYKIDSGKISMDLKYSIDQASLKGSNKINIDTLNLGEKVDSPDAINLPLGLAIALLKDSNGQIDIDLPVAGDMNNPEFSYGAVIWRAVGNLITGIVTAPFRFLGNMLGIDGDKLKSIDFALGQNAIIITEQEKLQNLEKILGKRPGIKISIIGSYDEALDTKALQDAAFKEILDAKQKEIQAKTKDAKADIYSLSLKTLYLQANEEKVYKTLVENFTDKKSEELDIAALNKAITTELSQKIAITKEALVALANQRAEAIKTELQTKYKIAPERIIFKDVESSKAARDEWVEVKIDITN